MREHCHAVSEPMPPGGGRIEGASVLRSHLGLASLLVRESVQNAWDARDDHRGDRPVRFAIEGWDLDDTQADHLRSVLPVDDLAGFARKSVDEETAGVVHPKAFLQRDTLQILVVSDRNTVGLCGPTRSGEQWLNPLRRGRILTRPQQRFANFVRNSGRATADIGHGDGGAFGIGKLALWMASRCGTILVHTRTTDRDGKPVERFIGILHGEHFYQDGAEYTGRHFVGRLVADGLVEPLEGVDAANAISGLPIPPYVDDGSQVDGTTIVVVAPRLTFGWPTEMTLIRDAVRWQVWPKLVPGARSGIDIPDMEISLGWNNNPVQLDDPLHDPELRPYARALLDCVRQRRSGDDELDHVPQCRSPKVDLGELKFREAGPADGNAFHRTLTEAEVLEAEGNNSEVDLAVPFDHPWGQIALIRREPLLLVRYEPIGGPDATATMIGVFLSAADPVVEAALTQAEPPAHDDWIHQNVPKDHPADHRRTLAKLTVKQIETARNRIRKHYDDVISAEHRSGEDTVSSRVSGRLLGGIGGGPRPSKPRNGGGVSGPGPRAALQLVRTVQRGAVVEHELDVVLGGLGPDAIRCELTPAAQGRDTTGTLDIDHLITYRWVVRGNAHDDAVLFWDAADDEELTLYVNVHGAARVRPSVKVKVIDGGD